MLTDFLTLVPLEAIEDLLAEFTAFLVPALLEGLFFTSLTLFLALLDFLGALALFIEPLAALEFLAPAALFFATVGALTLEERGFDKAERLRADPLFLPPPESLFTVAQARFSASFSLTPLFS